MQITQLFGVRAGHVNRREIEMCTTAGQNAGEICRAVFAVFVGAEVEADDTATRTVGEAGRCGLHAFIVKAKAVDRGLILGEAEEARFRVARLWARRDRADLNKAEPAFRQSVQRGRVFIEPSGQTDRVRQGHARNCGRKARRGERASLGTEAEFQRFQSEAMRHFGVGGAQDAHPDLFKQGHASSGN